MVIRLGQGYWVDASDGVNWTLMQDIADLKRPKTLGYFASLKDAMRKAVILGCHQSTVDIGLDALDAFVAEVAGSILSEVIISTVRDKNLGLVRHFTPKARGSVQERRKVSG